MFVVSPRLTREIARCFAFLGKEGEQHDYSINGTSMEVPFLKAHLLEDAAKAITKVKAGDVVTILPAVEWQVKNRVIMVEAHARLYTHGVPSFKRLYAHGDVAPTAITWSCADDLDLKKLPYLLTVYIIDEHIRG